MTVYRRVVPQAALLRLQSCTAPRGIIRRENRFIRGVSISPRFIRLGPFNTSWSYDALPTAWRYGTRRNTQPADGCYGPVIQRTEVRIWARNMWLAGWLEFNHEILRNLSTAGWLASRENVKVYTLKHINV